MGLAESLLILDLHDAGAPLKEASLAAFEEKLGATLPADYRRFLILRNGGRFYKSLLIPVPPTDYFVDSFSLEILFGLMDTPGESWVDLRHHLDRCKGRIPPRTFPIGEDCGGDCLLLDVSDETYGAVWLWVNYMEGELAPSDNKILIAKTFVDMAAACQRPPSEYLSDLETLEPFIAIERFDLPTLEYLLDSGLSPNTINEKGRPLIMVACLNENYEAAALLLSRGADPNRPDPISGKRPLYTAASGGLLDLVRLLLRFGASRYMTSRTTQTIAQSLNPPPRGVLAELLRIPEKDDGGGVSA
jgi:hypothetical protein